MNNSKLAAMLKNKRVVIVGPAECALKDKNGEFIDNFDLVVRVNRGIEPTDNFSEYIGKRTDLLYNCLYEHPDNGGILNIDYLKSKQVKFIIYHPEVSYQGIAIDSDPLNDKSKGALSKIKKSNYNNHRIDYKFYNSISSQVKCRPNTGFIALFHLLSFDIKELYITGYTFYLDNFMHGYKDHVDKTKFKEKCFKSERHNQKNLWKFLKEQKTKDSRIKTDKYLERILSLNNLNDNKETLNFVFS